MPPETPVYVMLGLGLAGIIGLIFFLAFSPQNKDNAKEIQINLGIVAGVTAILIGVFGGAAYMYFNANLNILPPFLLIMTFVNLFLSTLAVSASSLQISKS
jgi:hypothetical protein